MPQFVPGGTFSFLPDWLRTLSESQYDTPIQWYTCSHKPLVEIKLWVLTLWDAVDRQPDSIPLWAILKALNSLQLPRFHVVINGPSSQPKQAQRMSVSARLGGVQCLCNAPVWLQFLLSAACLWQALHSLWSGFLYNSSAVSCFGSLSSW